MRWLDGTINSTAQEFEQTLGDKEGQEVWRVAVHRVTESQTQMRG